MLPSWVMADRSPRILVVDDEQSVGTLLSYPLRKDGYEVVRAADGREALARFTEQPFDLVVLDVMLPQLDGLEVCRRLRARSSVPIIMLTAKSEEIDKVLGLELGADDYITKPFSMREFRSPREGGAAPRGDDPAARRGRRRRSSVDELRDRLRQALGARARRGRQDDLRRVRDPLGARPGAGPRLHPRHAARPHIWGDSAYRDPRTIDVHIRHLREKLEPDPKEPEYLFTVRGVGYRFRDTDELTVPCARSARRLALLFFSITAVAIAVIYFYVVPQLESNLREQKERTLATDASAVFAARGQRAGARRVRPAGSRRSCAGPAIAPVRA